MLRRQFAERLKAVPPLPGVYLMRDAEGAVLYVGKAASLRNRLRSYFGSLSGAEPKVRTMVARVADFEYILTQSEAEALILENSLIKRHRPRYNARLKDDKNYPYIKIDLKEDFPQLYFTRRVEPDGARYFGPFASAWSVRTTMDLLKKLFPYRSCTRVITGKDPHPCLEYHINRCVGPCIGAVDRQEYQRVIQQVIMFLEGKTEAVVRELRQKMRQAADNWQFERAAALRNQVQAIERVSETQKVVSTRTADEDVIALARGPDEAWVEVFFIRRGKLIGRDHFVMEGTQDENDGGVVAQFIQQFYDTSPFVPPLLLLQHPARDAQIIQQWLSQKRGGRVRMFVPRRGERRKLVEMVAQNAADALEQLRVRWLADADATERAMRELQEALNLPRLPQRIECYDISNIQGTNPTGSMVVFEGGRPRPAHYRRFKIQTVEGADDYAMMQEMLYRRFRRLAAQQHQAARNGHEQPPAERKGEAWGIVPDLVLIDGGKGHLSAALEVFLQLGIDFVPLASIAKQREELFLPHTPEPIVLPRSSHALHLVQRVRDEAHRFAITYHRVRRSKAAARSAMDLVPGIGPKRRRMLLRRFGSVKAVRDAALDDIAAVPGMTRRLAQKVKEYL